MGGQEEPQVNSPLSRDGQQSVPATTSSVIRLLRGDLQEQGQSWTQNWCVFILGSPPPTSG